MSNLSQKETSPGSSKRMTVQVTLDCWESLRKEAFDRRISIRNLLVEILRRHYGLQIPAGAACAESDGGMVSAA